ncbi:hypothetical protein BD324DRAFT_637373 [Kockovaella imperatae]|uniref:Proteasome subunit beta n=1 Tax=Kockovaella imperatae TaxID=4999 RepID=A0A1Y1U8E3_9TREE|nr:hypothetical protein BD324DRAFT_637373 [Kockovaella imperatae]ORX34282.1 hypothetical protein BD324DRAFT_637373 [Kockovaella imperatae]
MGDCSFGITGKDFVILASDMNAGRGIIKMKSDENKIRALGPHLAMAYGGETGDTEQFTDYVERNMRLYHIRNHNALLPPAASAWIRRQLAQSLRSRKPYAVNLLLGGFDTTTSLPHLYWIDYLGTKADIPYAAHGFGMYVALSTMDKWWFEGMPKEKGVELLRKCINEVQSRIVVQFNFNCILIDADGVHQLDLSASDPIADLSRAPEKAEVEVPNPIIAAPA